MTEYANKPDPKARPDKEKVLDRVTPAPAREERVVEKITTNDVILKKPGIGKKFKTVFFGGEFKGATSYILADVLLPAFRNLLVDATTKGVERVVYGESAIRPRRPPQYGSRVQYHSPFSRPMPPDPRGPARLPDQRPLARSVRRETNDLVLQTRKEAEDVLQALLDSIDQYESVSLADLYSMTGLPVSAIDYKWGWTYLTHTEIRQTSDGFLVDLPPAEEI